MSEHSQQSKTSDNGGVIEVFSDEESDVPIALVSLNALRRHSVIEVLSDESDDDEGVEFVAESAVASDHDEVQITGHNGPLQPLEILEYPGGPFVRRAPQPRRNVRRRPNPPREEEDMLFVDYYSNGRNGRFPFFIQDSVPEMLLQQQRALFRMFHSYGSTDAVSNTIMERLARDDEAALDRKIESENIHNRKMLRQKKKIAAEEAEGYTNNVSPEQKLLCELCGVELGEGIPADFKPDPRYDENLEEYAGKYRVNAPWFCIRQCFDADIELSKRVFAAKCGHVFCGRCIKNIGNRAPGRRSNKKEKLSIMNPQISAPRKCPAKGCGIMFTRGKKTFTELFM